LKYNRIGYFDEEFEELSVDEICKRIYVDRKDVDEIVKKTKFEVEGAVAYLGSKRVFRIGKESEVGFTVAELIMMNKNIHSHSKSKSFSTDDVVIAIKHKIKHIVAFNDEYFYSLKFDRFDFDFDKMFLSAFNKYDKILQDKVQRGEIVADQKDFVINHKIWKDIFEKIEGARYDYFRVRR